MHPGIYIHSVYIDPDPKEDKRATFVRSELSYPAHFSCDLQLLAYMSRCVSTETSTNK